MFIKRLYLKGYKRIALNAVGGLDINFDSRYQIILGTNGSGKSSIIQELSPLPAHPNDYQKGGMKIIEIEHGQNEYILTSNFEGKARHSFVKNGSELNESGTISIQRELVVQQFGISAEIREVMTGLFSFTQMTPSKRREFIFKISDQDMTYAFELYSKIATLTRDQKGAIKHNKERIAKGKVELSEIDLDKLSKEVKSIEDEITFLMEHTRKDLLSSDEYRKRIDQYLEQINQISTQILESAPKRNVESEGLRDQEDLNLRIRNAYAANQSKQQVYKEKLNEHDRVQKIVGDLGEDSNEDIDSLKKKREGYQQQIDKLRASIQQFHFDCQTESLIRDAGQLKSALVSIIQELPDNSDRRFSQDNYEKLKKDIEKRSSDLERLRSQYTGVDTQIEKMENTDHTHCPKCNHQFQVGVCEKELEKARQRRKALFDQISSEQKKLEELQGQLQQMEHCLELYRRLRQLASNYPNARNLFSCMIEEGRIYHAPSQFIPTIDVWVEDLKRANKIEKLDESIKIIDRSIEQLTQIQTSSQGQLKESLTQLDEQINELTADIRQTKEEYQRLSALSSKIENVYDQGQKLHDLYTRFISEYESYINAIQNDEIRALISRLQSELATKVEEYKVFDRINNSVKDLESSLSELERKHQAYKLLSKALSPTDGIIADQMLEFISTLISQANEIISSVYTYNLQILPCKVEQHEFDYKFPLIVGEEQIEVDDISKASDGQREIIDFSFKLLALVYLGFQDYPLYLDELGRHQDETHLANITEYVKRVIESGRHSQLFMVQHYAVGHGAFTQAQVCVLDPSNISVPSQSNEHVEFL